MVIKKKDKHNWEYCIYLGKDDNGKKKYKRKSGFKSKKACIEDARNYIKIDNNQIFENVCYMFLDRCKNKGLRPTTIITYKRVIDVVIDQFSMSKKNINSINIDHIYKFIEDYTKLHSNNYNRKIIETLKYIFKFARDNGITTNNILKDIPFPKALKNSRDIWTEEEVKRYLPILKKCKYYDIIYLTLETGLRRGEIVALTWDCVNLDRGTLLVNKSYVYVSGYNGITTPKTEAGYREIALLDESIRILKRRYKEKTSKYVFASEKDPSIPANPHTVSKYFRDFLKNNNIKSIRFHDLRHIHATLLLNHNVNYKMVSKRLGHTSIAFTLQTYTHITTDYEIQFYKKLSRLF